VIEMNKSSKI